MTNPYVTHNSLYDYKKIMRKETNEGRRYQTPDGDIVASVTTILDKTKSDEKKKILSEWKQRVGVEKAQAITTEAAGRGTTMHKQLENWLEHGELKTGSNSVHQQGAKMATVIIEEYLKGQLQEYWGMEAVLYYPELYAGTTDLVGVYNGKPSIIDYKQTNRPKKTEWIHDYFIQGAAYAAAHNKVFGTDIKQIVILMCSKDCQPQRWIITGEDFDSYTNDWWDRVWEFYANKP
jgi:ATP-dependent exoDNAse (exonuclease V) beta subunit